MARQAEEECDPKILELHAITYLSVKEQDKILEDYFNSNRPIPSPLEIEIYQRQLRNDPERQRLLNDRITRNLRAQIQ